MTAKEFLSDKNLSAVEITGNTLVNLVIDNVAYGLKVDTSNIQAGTILQKVTNFKYENDIITVGNIVINLLATEMLMPDASIVEKEAAE